MRFFSQRRCTYHGLLVLTATMALAVLGCGPSKANVTGTVKYNGQLLPSGTITFLSQEGDKQVVHSEIVDGKYSIPSIEAGKALVTVTTTPPAQPGAVPNGAPAPPPVSAGKYVPIPAKYSNPETSNLSYDAKGGAQSKDFDLTP